MTWYVWKKGRWAYAPNEFGRCTRVMDIEGTWIRIGFGFFYRWEGLPK